MAHIRTAGAGPDGFETGQSIEFSHLQPEGERAWEPAVIEWKFENTKTGNTGYVIRLLDEPSHSNMQTVPFNSSLIRAVA